jgi:3-carboxy-cis,cis-muconate cycloisomerase
LPDIVRLTAGALQRMAETAPRLEINRERMMQNLDETRGLIYAEAVTMALAKEIGKSEAHKLVEVASERTMKQRRHFREVLAGDAQISKHISKGALAELFDPHNYLGDAEAFVDQVVACAAQAASTKH